jgi:hypothetical protein
MFLDAALLGGDDSRGRRGAELDHDSIQHVGRPSSRPLT